MYRFVSSALQEPLLFATPSGGGSSQHAGERRPFELKLRVSPRFNFRNATAKKNILFALQHMRNVT